MLSCALCSEASLFPSMMSKRKISSLQGFLPFDFAQGRNDKLQADLSGERLIEFRYGFVEGLA